MATTLRDALTDALDKSEDGTLQTPVETSIEVQAPAGEETQQQREDRLRDERGRFAKGEDKTAAAVDPKVVDPNAAPAARKPPASWKKDYWGHWEKFDPQVKDYIDQREQEFAKGVSTYKNQWDQVAPVYEALQPFMPDLQRNNISPAQWVTNLGSAHRTLALGSMDQRIQMFAKLAVDYGIPLQALVQGGRVDPQNAQLMQTVSQLSQEVTSWKNQQAQAQQSALQEHIAAFSKDAPHFEAVRDTMAGLLQSGVATDLKSAYEKAVRLHDDIWQQEQVRQAEQQRQGRQQELERKKRAAASPRSASPTGSTQGSAKKGLRDTLEESFDSVSSGRF